MVLKKPNWQNEVKIGTINEDLFRDVQNIAQNPEQLQAVIQILSGSSHPHPYLLFGPPGTGKTVTLAEAIKQVWKMDSKTRIIVATPSNSAADVIALRLKEDIPKGG